MELYGNFLGFICKNNIFESKCVCLQYLLSWPITRLLSGVWPYTPTLSPAVQESFYVCISLPIFGTNQVFKSCLPNSHTVIILFPFVFIWLAMMLSIFNVSVAFYDQENLGNFFSFWLRHSKEWEISRVRAAFGGKVRNKKHRAQERI